MRYQYVSHPRSIQDFFTAVEISFGIQGILLWIPPSLFYYMSYTVVVLSEQTSTHI